MDFGYFRLDDQRFIFNTSLLYFFGMETFHDIYFKQLIRLRFILVRKRHGLLLLKIAFHVIVSLKNKYYLNTLFPVQKSRKKDIISIFSNYL